MEKIEINPDNYQAEYIKHINECFNHWGQNREYDWAFNRQVGDKAADIMIIRNEEDEVIAGSAVTYRKLANHEGRPIDIGIMTGSWTLPKARGRGCFSKIIEISRELAGKKGAPYLTAFVTESNASYRRLRDAGSSLLPTSLLFSPEQPYDGADSQEVKVLEDNKEVRADLYEKFKRSQKADLSFTYTPDEFYRQYIDRPKKVEILKVGDEYAIVEETHNVVRVLLLTFDQSSAFEKGVKSLTNWALKERQKKLMLFSTRKEVNEAAEKLGFENMQGYFTILSTSDEAAAEPEELLRLNIQMGDKM